MKKNIIILTVCFLFLVTGCSKDSTSEKTKYGYTRISSDIARDSMEEKNTVLVDVRTEEEYASGHLKGAINIPLHAIDGTVISTLKDYQQKILVYCESGNRSIQASAKFAELGYKNVYEIGGIKDYPSSMVTK
ncbi:MAG: rhodanese-like domain-containing protein [Firmicutes bacterium]|nr:rhodanese-like domain-containing protein [Bacillota bacterium]